MTEKTPYQIMREQQQSIIDNQRIAAENRAKAYQQNIEIVTQQELNEKNKQIAEEKERIAKRRLEILKKQKRKYRRQQNQNTSTIYSTHYSSNPSYSNPIGLSYNNKDIHNSYTNNNVDSSCASDSYNNNSDSSSNSSSCSD